MKDVFAGLGSGLVKCADAGLVKGSREEKPDFERQQMERSGGQGMREEKRGMKIFHGKFSHTVVTEVAWTSRRKYTDTGLIK